MPTLPENKRRNVETPSKRTMWIYGAPFSGKTTFADSAPDPLMLNTDGNAVYVTAPYISIQDEIKVNGRITTRNPAWQVFKDYIEELEQITQAAAHEWWNEKAMVDFNNDFNAYLDQCGARILDGGLII